MKKYVFIQSDRTINVTSGLEIKDITNPSLPIKDNLKVKPLWPKTTVQILQGRHLYPSIVANFNTVKTLINNKVLTIGEFTNDITEDYERIAKLDKQLKSLIETQEVNELKEKETKKKKEAE